MGEQTKTRLNPRTAVCKFPSEERRKKPLRSRRRIIMAVSLGFILTTTGLVYYLMPPPPSPPYIPPDIPPEPIETTPHSPIEIIGDANFSATARLEGWPGDGSPENPYIIDGLIIGGQESILIKDTRVSFTISNCNFTGDPHQSYCFLCHKVGIYLENVMHGVLVKNVFVSNYWGLILDGSDSNTVVNNTCYNNGIGIILDGSDSNTVVNNTCYNNEIGISLHDSYSNTVVNNTCLGNTEHDMLEEYNYREEDPEAPEAPENLLLIGSVGIIVFLVIILLGGMWIAVKRVSKEGN